MRDMSGRKIESEREKDMDGREKRTWMGERERQKERGVRGKGDRDRDENGRDRGGRKRERYKERQGWGIDRKRDGVGERKLGREIEVGE